MFRFLPATLFTAAILWTSPAAAQTISAGTVTGTVTFSGKPISLTHIYSRTASFIPAGESENMFREVRVLLSDRVLTDEEVVNHTQDGQPRTIKFTGVRVDFLQPGSSLVALHLFNATGAGSHLERPAADGHFPGVMLAAVSFKSEVLSGTVKTDGEHANPVGMPGAYSFSVTFSAPLSH
jgi:hypothetical protein